MRSVTNMFAASRREFIFGGATLAGLAALSPGWALGASNRSPIILRPSRADVQLLLDGEPRTRVWAYNTTVPGPLLRVRQGETVRARLQNGIDSPTTIHWHGVRIDNAMDGVAGLTQEAVATGDSFDYTFTPPDAGTFWYHPHNRSWEQVARGLYGVLVVDEPDPPPVDQDAILALDDWRIDEHGQIDDASFGSMHDRSHAGRLGNAFTVNGRSVQDIPVRSGERLRLRLCNTANARVMNLALEQHEPTVIATDGQPVAPRALGDGRITLAPGQRLDVIVDMSLAPGSRAEITEVTGGGRLVGGAFVYDAVAVARDHPLDASIRLPANPLSGQIDLDGALVVELVMEGGAMGGMREALYRGRTLDIRDLVQEGVVWAFNGVAGRPEKPLFDVKRGRTVVLRMVNQTAWPHAMHMHGHHGRLLDTTEPRAGAPWLDTVLVSPREQLSWAFVADNPGKWMLHCHMLEHQAAGMTTWFRVSG